MGVCRPGQWADINSDFDPYLFQEVTLLDIPESSPVWEIALKIALTFYVLIFLVDIVGNTIVILTVAMIKRMRTPTNILILNLAISDLLVAFFCMWVHAGNQLTNAWPFDSYVCKVNSFMQVLCLTESVLTLTTVSIERFLAIVYPLKPRMNTFVTLIVIAVTWLLSTAMACPQLVYRRQYELHWKNYQEVWCQESFPKVYIDSDCNTNEVCKKIYYMVQSLVMYFIPILIMAVTYIVIIIKMIFRKIPGRRVTKSSQEKAKKKVIRMLIAVLVVFVICCTPQQAISIWSLYRSHENVDDYTVTIKYIAVFVAYMNSALNPILYAGFNDNFRKGFREAFHCHLLTRLNKVTPASKTNQRTNTSTAVQESNVDREEK